MAYGVNSPFGLQARGHLLGGGTAIKQNDNYIISASSGRLNRGDPVVFSTTSGDYAVTPNNLGALSEIKVYTPTPIFNGAGARSTIAGSEKSVVGVFQGCRFEVNGKLVEQEYWVPGTITSSLVRAIVVDDPYVIWSIQLSSFTGAVRNAMDKFTLLPCLQVQNASWPNTGGLVGAPATNPTMANSAVIGSNLELMTGNNVSTAPAADGTSGTMAGIVINNIVQNYRDNPLIVNQGKALGNPLGVSTFYACPSLAATLIYPAIADGLDEYDRTTSNLKVIGFDNDPRNIPGKFGVHPTDPALATAGTYFNTPFLNVLVTINKHVNKASTPSVILV